MAKLWLATLLLLAPGCLSLLKPDGDAGAPRITIDDTQIGKLDARGSRWLIPLSSGQTISNGTSRVLYVTDVHVLTRKD